MKLFQSTLPRGSDVSWNIAQLTFMAFQSTLPRGSDDTRECRYCFAGRISIHAPSRERQVLLSKAIPVHYFNPRSLAGATRGEASSRCRAVHFNPRSLAGATQPGCGEKTSDVISIHAPSRERHTFAIAAGARIGNFNPRSLAGATLSKRQPKH